VTDRPTAVALPERYVDNLELAELMGVSTSTIKRFVAAGMPSETWGMRRTRRYLPSACIAWARDRAADKVRIEPILDAKATRPDNDNRRE
jgi:phage terminase Nu1 subunit (DNA packaging protein)